MRAAALLAAIAATGCYATVEIRPDQIPKLTDARTSSVGPPVTLYSYNGATGTFGSTTVQGFERSRIEMLAPDGSTVVVKGDADLDLDTVDGRHYHFEHPIEAHLEGDVLVISADDRTGRIALRDVASAHVRSISLGKSIVAAVGGSLGFSALMLAPLLL